MSSLVVIQYNAGCQLFASLTHGWCLRFGFFNPFTNDKWMVNFFTDCNKTIYR